MGQTKTLLLDGQSVSFSDGDTILDVARRENVSIPALCHDPRLDPAGACRSCLVEIEGQRRLMPSCATAATDKMVVLSSNARIQRHQKTLLALYLSDHPEGHEACETGKPCELHQMAKDVGAPTNWMHMAPKRASYIEDRNPYITFQADRCILCARCTRYCDEVEGVSAITLAKRGSETTISTADGISLLDSSCELCGGCVAVCPTGAMAEKQPLLRNDPPERELEKVRTTCNYCGVGCQMDLNVDPAGNDGRGRVVKVTSPDPGTTTNDGNLCVKGRFAYDFMDHPDRLTVPLIRGDDGDLHEATWDEAIRAAADGLLRAKERYGADSLAFVSSSRCTGEENYLVQKLSRVAFGTNNVHQCSAT
jgi:predicted molibdopterin-dependent oxidoreductase YjgC